MARYLIGNIKGPKGDTGAQGPAGQDGAIQYTAGTGIDITNNVISATGGSGGPTYTAGDGITIANDTISVNNTVAKTADLATVATSGSYTDLSNKPAIPIYTAGNNITISNGEISATDTTYTAGTGIDITGNVISATGGEGSEYGDPQVLSCIARNFGMGQNTYEDNVTLGTGTAGAGGTISFIHDDSDNYSSYDLIVTVGDNEYTFYPDEQDTWVYETYTITVGEYIEDPFGYPYSGTIPAAQGDSYTVVAFMSDETTSTLWPNYVPMDSIYYDMLERGLGGSSLPSISSGDAGKVLTVNSTEDDVEWTTPSGGSSYTAGNGIEIDANNEISNNRYSIFPVSRETSGWYSFASTKDAFIAKLNNGDLVKTMSALDRVSITPAEITSGRTNIIYVGGSYSSSKVSVQEVNTIQLVETKFYYLAKGRVMDTLYRFDGPESIWKTLPIELTYESGTYKSTLLSLFNGKQNTLPARANNAGKVLAVNSDASGYEWVAQSSGGSSLPTIASGDAGKVLSVNSGETGVEWTTVSGGGSSLPNINSGDALKVLGVNLNETGTEWVDTMRGCKINGTNASGLAPLVAMLKENKAPAKLPKYLINGYEVYYLVSYAGLNTSTPTIFYAKTVFDYNQLMFGNYVRIDFIYLTITFNSSMDITNVATKTLNYPLINIPNPQYNANKILAANSDGSGVQWITAPSGGTAANAATALYLKDANNVVYEITVDTSGSLTATQVSNN